MQPSIWTRFAPRLRKTIFAAIDEVSARGGGEVAAEHLFLAVLRDSDSAAAFMLGHAGAPSALVLTELESRLGSSRSRNGRCEALSASGRRLLQMADEESRKLQHAHVGTEHLLLALIKGTSGPAGEILDHLGVTYEAARLGLNAWTKQDAPRPSRPARLSRFLPPRVRDALARVFGPALRKAILGYRVYVRLSLGHPGFTKNPYPLYRQLRRQMPVRRDPIGNVWVVTSYEHVLTVLRDARFQRDPFNVDHLPPAVRRELGLAENVPSIPENGADLFALQMLFLDPPRHTRLRRLLARSFTPQVVQNLRPRIQELGNQLLESAKQGPSFDVIKDFAYPLPTMVIAELLGFPPGDYEKLKTWSDDFAALLGFDPSAEQQSRAVTSLDEMRMYFDGIIANVRFRRSDSLLSLLLANEEDGDRLADAELFANCILLLAAGHETTTNLIGNGMLALLRRPDQFATLGRDPTIIAGAIEELLRFDSPVQWTSRVAAQPLELGGQKLNAGDFVIASLGAANHDPTYFLNPERLDLTRPASENKHLAFGSGIHFCLGAALARLEGQVAIEAIVTRFPQMKLSHQKLRWRKGVVFRGLQALKVNTG